MAHLSSPQKIESLRSAALNLGQLTDSDCDQASLAALKRIIENRIAALELLQAAARAAEDP